MDHAGWKPGADRLMTRWGKDVDPANVLPEYPRPQMARDMWLNLNGLWDYAVVPRKQARIETYTGRILVPFCIESALSGVKQPLKPENRLWYRRYFTVPETWRGQRILLHFGAVDWEATVAVNGREVGRHTGGYYPFDFEITALIKEGANDLVVAVWDPTDTSWQEKGKQTLKPGGIMYTPVSGIWQTVWLEAVPQTYIAGMKMTPDIDHDRLDLLINVDGSGAEAVAATVLDQGMVIGTCTGRPGEVLHLEVKNPQLWSPESPFLYDLKVTLLAGGRELDSVKSYFGMRKFGVGRDRRGIPRLFLNNRPLFQSGVLDQGYWPDGIYTAPTDDALAYDVALAKRLGFNMIRKHIKVEPARWYYHCDRQGLIVWQDMVSGGYQVNPILSAIFPSLGLRMNDTWLLWRFGRQDAVSHTNYRKEFQAMLDALYNVPCIALWVPFNEAWGQFEANAIAAWVKGSDPTRVVDHASGWYDQGGGDCLSLHSYLGRLKPPRRRDQRVWVLSEFGGLHHDIPGHFWKEGTTFGYRKFKSVGALSAAYREVVGIELKSLIKSGLSAAVYTQISDVEGETNGLITYDREVVKMDANLIRELNNDLYQEMAE